MRRWTERSAQLQTDKADRLGKVPAVTSGPEAHDATGQFHWRRCGNLTLTRRFETWSSDLVSEDI